jgi:hypothetical protein
MSPPPLSRRGNGPLSKAHTAFALTAYAFSIVEDEPEALYVFLKWLQQLVRDQGRKWKCRVLVPRNERSCQQHRSFALLAADWPWRPCH